MSDILRQIIAQKKKEVKEAQAEIPLDELKSKIKDAPPPRGFLTAIQAKHKKGEYALIAEIKKASPSKGVIREDFDPATIARQYQEGGAACLSVLTDQKFFQGSKTFIEDAKRVTNLPCLQKDFLVVAPYQVFEARVLGADAILVIMAAVSKKTAKELVNTAKELGMDVIVEVHNEEEINDAIVLNAEIIGINNRDLNTFETDLEITEKLAPLVYPKTVISESGLFSNQDLVRISRAGVNTFLVGESLMKQNNVTLATQTLLNGNREGQK